MKAALTTAYGAAGVLQMREVARPTLKAHEVLVQIRATAVTAGDVRLRTADFPSLSALPGRLMIGLFRPKHPIQGTTFAGRIVEVGSAVTRWTVGDDVFGSAMRGTYAEYIALPETSAMARLPAKTSYDEAAAVPYGAFTALHFLREVASVRPGDSVLVVGASGGVGRFAVQIAKHLGAEVTAVCSREAFELVQSLGADHVIDHKVTDFTRNGARYDVIFDTAGVTSFGRSRSSLSAEGRYLTLFLSVSLLVHVLLTSIFGGRKAKFTVAFGDHDDMQELRELMERGVLRPVIARRFPLDDIADAHVEAETGRSHGSVMVTLLPA
jgi:NADPH:quinone reductase-like Zn-dependent oxidoreductase